MTHTLSELEAAFDLTPLTGGHRLDSLGSILGYALELMQSVAPEQCGGNDALHKKLCNDQSAIDDYIFTGPHSWWFRGVASDYDLNSGIFRIKIENSRYATKVIDYADLDRRLQHEYFFMTRRRSGEVGTTIWDRLFEMQHYGMRTRLLDWTFNLLTAVFFAVQDRRDAEGDAKSKGKTVPGDAVVWMLNPRLLWGAAVGETALNDLSYLEMHGSEEELQSWNSKPPELSFGRPGWIFKWLIAQNLHVPIVANSTNERQIAQSGCFTLQGGSNNSPSLNKYASEKAADGCAQFLLKFRIDSQRCDEIARQLQLFGLDRRFLFPERDSASRSLRYHHGLE